MSRKILLSSIKNEGPFILEWVAYHRVIGFEEIFITYNDCDDGSEEMLMALDSIGWVTAVPNNNNNNQAPQISARSILLEQAAPSSGDWCIWLDTDEFLNIHTGHKRLDDLISAIGGYDGILINWRIFGDGNGIYNGSMLSAPFILSSSEARNLNQTVKTLFKYGDHIESFDIHRPILNSRACKASLVYLAGSGLPLDLDQRSNKVWFNGAGSRLTSRVSRSEFGWKLAQVNHYAVRDRNLFEKKKLRGRGYKAKIKPGARHDDSYWNDHNLNDVEDISILSLHNDVRRVMTEALNKYNVKLAHNLVDHKLTTPNNLSAEVQNKANRPNLTLPMEVGEYVKSHYSQCNTLLEYGSGGSTVLAGDLGVRNIFSVESDADWYRNMNSWFIENPPTGKVMMHYADIGPTKTWAKPKNDKSFRSWPSYAISVWDRPDFENPDLVLIDGRFRLACFLTTLIRTKRTVTILWDDYTDRESYHSIENIIQPIEFAGRMAKFEINPQHLAGEYLQMLADSFLDPA